MHWYAWLLIAVCVVVIFLPPSMDPAIKVNERRERKCLEQKKDRK